MGRAQTEESKRKNAEKHIGKTWTDKGRQHYRENYSGQNHPRWVEDRSKLQKRIMTWRDIEWRKAVFKRDGYTCQTCGKKGGHLNAHHIKSFSKHEELRYDLNNGITLCKPCHYYTHSKNSGVQQSEF